MCGRKSGMKMGVLHLVSTGRQTAAQLAAICARVHPYADAIHVREKGKTAREVAEFVVALLRAGVPAQKLSSMTGLMWPRSTASKGCNSPITACRCAPFAARSRIWRSAVQCMDRSRRNKPNRLVLFLLVRPCVSDGQQAGSSAARVGWGGGRRSGCANSDYCDRRHSCRQRAFRSESRRGGSGGIVGGFFGGRSCAGSETAR